MADDGRLGVQCADEPGTSEKHPEIEGRHAQPRPSTDAVPAEPRRDLASPTAGSIADPDYPPPTDEEGRTLRKVHDSIPLAAWSLCLVEMAERALFYGVKAPFNNYLQFLPPPGGQGTGAIDPGRPNAHAGALGLGLQTSAAIGLSFSFY